MSDTHAAPFLTAKTWHLPRVDVLLHCGDLSNSGSLSDYRGTISLLESVPAEIKLVIAGNHDKTLDQKYWNKHIEMMQARGEDVDQGLHYKAKELWTSDEVRRAGIFYLDEGTHKFTLRSGASFTVCPLAHPKLVLSVLSPLTNNYPDICVTISTRIQRLGIYV